MKADDEFGGQDGPEPEDLRTILRHWRVPPPPREIEDQLRRTFRQRRSRRRPAVWLAVAASLALILVYQARRAGPPTTPPVTERSAPALPPPPPAVAVEAHSLERSNAPGAATHALQPAAGPSVDEAVIVEPRQAELLAQLARQLHGARQAQLGVSLPRIEAVPADSPARPIRAAQARDTVLEYSSHWETVEDEWPFVHRPL